MNTSEVGSTAPSLPSQIRNSDELALTGFGPQLIEALREVIRKRLSSAAEEERAESFGRAGSETGRESATEGTESESASEAKRRGARRGVIDEDEIAALRR